MSYFIQEYQEDLEDEDEDSEVELVVQVYLISITSWTYDCDKVDIMNWDSERGKDQGINQSLQRFGCDSVKSSHKWLYKNCWVVGCTDDFRDSL